MPRHRAILGAVLLVAAALRFSALDFGGRDFEARPDENGIVATLATLERGGLFPPFVLYGGGYFAPLGLFVRAWQSVAWDGGVSAQIAAGALDDVRVAVRTWSALLGLLTVAGVYVVGKAAGGVRVGLLAAAVLAVLPLAVREAHFGKADTAAAAAGTLVMAALVLARRPEWWRGGLVGVTTAVALGTKALVSVLPAAVFGLAWPAAAPGRVIAWRALGWAGAACAGTFLLLHLPVLRHLDVALAMAPPAFGSVRDVTWLPGGADAEHPLVYHATVSLRWGCGLAVTVLALPAVIFGASAGGPLRVLALFVAVHGAVLLASPGALARYALPALPPLVVLIAGMIVAASDRTFPAGRARRFGLAMLAALVVAEPLVASVRLVRLLGRADTRSLAGDWIAAQLPADARLVSWGAPPGANDYGRPPSRGRAVVQSLDPSRWDAVARTYVGWHSHPLPYSSEALPEDAPPLRRLAVFDPFGGGDGTQSVFEPLDAFYLPLGRFTGIERPGPRIEIFAVDAPPVD